MVESCSLRRTADKLAVRVRLWRVAVVALDKIRLRRDRDTISDVDRGRDSPALCLSLSCHQEQLTTGYVSLTRSVISSAMLPTFAPPSLPGPDVQLVRVRVQSNSRESGNEMNHLLNIPWRNPQRSAKLHPRMWFDLRKCVCTNL